MTADQDVKSINVSRIVNFWLVIVTLLSFFVGHKLSLFIIHKMIAADSWIITILPEGQKEKGSAARYIGMIVGKLITFNLFIPLNSIHFINQYIYTTP